MRGKDYVLLRERDLHAVARRDSRTARLASTCESASQNRSGVLAPLITNLNVT